MEKLVMSVYPNRNKRKELLTASHMISSQTLGETGCMDCRVFSGRGEESAIHLEQDWRTRHQLDEYFQSDHFTALLGAMKLLANTYEVTINNGTHAEGIEAVDRARRLK